MQLPKRISPCPIVEALAETRFDTNVPADAVFGLVYNAIKGDFPKVEKFPITNLPESIRLSNPAFEFNAHQKLLNGDYFVIVGPRVVV